MTTLYPFQQTKVNAILAALSQGESWTIQYITGNGDTHVAACVANIMSEKHTVVIFCPKAAIEHFRRLTVPAVKVLPNYANSSEPSKATVLITVVSNYITFNINK